jgi:hypothetical protein
MVRLLVELWEEWDKGEIMGTKRKQKGFSFNPLDHSFFGGDLEFNPSGALSGWEKDLKEKRELKVIEGLLAKEKKKAQNKELGILEHDEGGEYTDKENEVLKKVFAENDPTGESQGKLAVRDDYDKFSPEVLGIGIEDEEGESVLDMIGRENKSHEDYSKYAQAGHGLDQISDDSFYSNEQDVAREDHLLRRGAESPISGGMTDNAFASESSPMSPAMKKYAVGLLQDFMTPQQDDPPQQVRGAGISRGGGTPFPSLLAKKPERPKYVNKGLI